MMRKLGNVLFRPCDFSSFFFAYHFLGFLILNINHLGEKVVRIGFLFLFLSFLCSLFISEQQKEPYWLCTRSSNPHLHISTSFCCWFPNTFTMIVPLCALVHLIVQPDYPFWPFSNCSILSLGFALCLCRFESTLSCGICMDASLRVLCHISNG